VLESKHPRRTPTPLDLSREARRLAERGRLRLVRDDEPQPTKDVLRFDRAATPHDGFDPDPRAAA
jgi:hypothetical protein